MDIMHGNANAAMPCFVVHRPQPELSILPVLKHFPGRTPPTLGFTPRCADLG